MTRRRGFSLVEVVISLVLLSIMGTALTRLMTSQLRYFSLQGAQKAARSAARSSLNLLESDLRLVEVTGGVVSASNSKLVVNVPFAIGIVCGGSTISLLPLDSLTGANAVISGYAWRDTAASAPYVYVPTGLFPVIGSSPICTVLGTQVTTLPGGRVLTVSPALVLAPTGAPIFLYETISYEFKASSIAPGQIGLWRTVAGGPTDELAAPFDTTSKFRYFALDADTSQVSVPTTLSTIRGVELELDALSANRVAGRSSVERVSVRTAVLFRNRT
jgi:prepilin-type N-terminal cleavage/methylation domain-containing protein